MDPMVVSNAMSEFIANSCFDVKLSQEKRQNNVEALKKYVRQYATAKLESDLLQVQLNDELKLLIG